MIYERRIEDINTGGVWRRCFRLRVVRVNVDKHLIERVVYVAQRARAEGFEDVAAWMQKHLAQSMREQRPHRARGKVTLARVGKEAVLPESIVKQALELDEKYEKDEITDGIKTAAQRRPARAWRAATRRRS